MSNRHAVVWLDHAQAHVLFIDAANVERSIIEPTVHPRLHHKRGWVDGDKLAADPTFFDGIAQALHEPEEILIAGPGQAKLELFKYLQAHAPEIAKHVVGLETADDMTDGQLASHARRYFKLPDRVQGY